MRQFLLPAVPAVPAARPGAVLEITGSDYHYLVRVLRLRPGAVIPVADAAGRRGRATVTAIDHRSARLRIAAEGAETAPGPGPGAGTETGAAAQAIGEGAAEASARFADPAAVRAPGAPGALTLIQALPKGALMDRIVRQATELGATRLAPVVAERSQGRAGDAAQARRWERWQRIARQAAQQSGAGPPVIEQPVPLRRYLEELPAGGLNLLFDPDAEPLPAAMVRAKGGGSASGAAPPLALRCAVGPEGGFSPAEAALFRDHGFRAVGLPAGLLRVDTAAVAALVTGAQFLLSLHAAPAPPLTGVS